MHPEELCRRLMQTMEDKLPHQPGHGVDIEDDIITMDDFIQDVVEGRGDNDEDLGDVIAALDPEDA